MKTCLTFDDVLIVPKFSCINSRKEVSLSNGFSNLPIISANMDTVTEASMAKAMKAVGGLACLHRFWPIEKNVAELEKSAFEGSLPWVSVGVGIAEAKRAEALFEAGARHLVLDVAHGAQKQVVDQYKWLKDNLPDVFVVIGNFATSASINEFWIQLNKGSTGYGIDGVKVGVGPGSACTTRLKTGVGIPQLSAILDVANWLNANKQTTRPLVIADGGCKASGDIAKALAAGADMVMLGGMLAGTDETPGDLIQNTKCSVTETGVYEYPVGPKYKKYRGSASKESYADQGKDWECAEGEAFTVPYKGPVAKVLADIEGGLRSAFTYVGAATLKEFQEKTEFVQITNNGVRENGAHGKGV